MFTLGRILGIIGGAWGIIATIAIFTLPLYEGRSVTGYSTGERIEQTFRLTLLEANPDLAPITILFFSIMVAASLIALLLAVFARRKQRRWAAGTFAFGILLLFGAFISGFSIGGFYLPGAALTTLGGVLLVFD